MFEPLALILIVTFAAFLQGLTGFGFGLIALPLLGLFIPLKTIIPLVLMLALFICITLSVQLRHSINWKIVTILSVSTIPGIPLGIYILQSIQSQPLALALGVLMVAFTAHQLFATPSPRPLGTPYAVASGFACGVLTASISAGGPPAIIYATLQPWSKDETKGTLAAYFFFSGGAAIASQAYTGFVTSDVISYFVQSLPALIIGILAGTYTYKLLSDNKYRKLTQVLVLLLGCMMIYKNI